MCFSCLCKRNLIIKAKNPLGNVCPFISLAVFHLLSVGWAFGCAWFFFGGGRDLFLFAFSFAVHNAHWQSWYLLFDISSSVSFSCPLLVERVFCIPFCTLTSLAFCSRVFNLLEIHHTWSCSDEFAWLRWAFWDRPTAQQLVKENNKK